MKFKNSFASLALISTILISSPAHAILDLGLITGGNFTRITFDFDDTQSQATLNTLGLSFSPSLGLMAGPLAQLTLLPMLGLEAGLFYAHQTFGMSFDIPGFANSEARISANVLQMPVLLRFWPLPFVSFGGGGFFSYGIGNLKMASTLSGPAVTATKEVQEESYERAEYSRKDWGIVVSMGGRVPLPATGISIIADARYLWGLHDLNTGAPSPGRVTSKTRTYQIFAGVLFELF